ncbi:MAG: single-stranded-DNA-specific exonuclease RecJ [Pseudomonadota bacterium]
MNFSEKRWHIFPDQPHLQSILQKELRISPLFSKLLINRNITDPDTARRFLSSTLHDLRHPFLMKDIKRASHRIIKAVHQKETIGIFGDYDVDGITGTAILKLFLDSIGAKVTFYIPHRVKEGYGLNIPALEEIGARKVSLLITVDCGISNYEEVLYARDQGIDVIVSDHHEVPEKVPEAYAVINPKQKECNFPFKHLAGVGIAFYLIMALRILLREEGFWSAGSPPNLRDYLDLVALGTVADIVPLVEENRVFVKHGITVMNENRKLGLMALKKVSRLENAPITPEIVAYRVAPRINAAGRLNQADKGVILLTTAKQWEAESIAQELDAENTKRQHIETTIVKEACRIIETTDHWVNQKAFVLASPDWHPGVIGIGASRIAEKYSRPTILISLEGDIGRGSARSIEAFSILAGLKGCQELLIKFGGHESAAGLTVSKENITHLREKLNALVHEALSPEDFIPKIYVDTQIDLAQVNESLIQEIQALAPFGTDNPEPLFASDVLSVTTSHIVGNGHLKMRIGRNGVNFEAIGFSMGNFILDPHSQIRIVFIPEINTWQGLKNLRLRMKDIQIING